MCNAKKVTACPKVRCGHDMKVIMEGPEDIAPPDHRLLQEVLRAIRWFNCISSGKFKSAEEIATLEKCRPTLVSSRMRLAFLAPDIVETILEGRQPSWLSNARLRELCPLPASWEEQRRLLLGTAPRRSAS